MPATFSAFALGQRGFIAYLAFLNAFVPISLDLYLPALPTMAEYFQASPEMVNLTVSLFTLFFALSMLFWGPFSDKYGRKPILLLGIGIYIVASIGLAMCNSIGLLIVGRCLQAVGSGAVSGVSMAIVKDAFKGRTMENVLTWIQTVTVLAPMLAPVLGGLMLRFTTWRGIFWILCLCGCLALGGWFLLRETVAERLQGSALASLGRVGYVLKQRDFRNLLLVFSAGAMSFMAYLATSSYIYKSVFHATPQEYSYFFAANAAVSVLGPLLYVRFFRNLPRRGFIAACYAITALAGAALILFGAKGPFIFAALFAPISILGGALRPPSTMLMMNQLETDNGTVASLVGSSGLLFGGCAMLLCSLPWSSFILAAGTISLVVGVFCASSWLWLDRNRKFTGTAIESATGGTPAGQE